MICHDVLSEVDRVYAHAYEFRTKRQFDKASRIEHLVEQLVDCKELLIKNLSYI